MMYLISNIFLGLFLSLGNAKINIYISQIVNSTKFAKDLGKIEKKIIKTFLSFFHVVGGFIIVFNLSSMKGGHFKNCNDNIFIF